MTDLSLIPIDRAGAPAGYFGELPAVARAAFQATADLYRSVGFERPWIGYLCLANSSPVGTCGFKSPPRDGRVEIAYLTFPDLEGRGYATAMATALVSLATQRDPSISVVAQTLPTRNASHRILEKLGFEKIGSIEHPEDGPVWEWQIP